MGLSLLYHAFGEGMHELDLPVIRNTDHEKIKRITEAIRKRINCPLSSGAGRLFDAIAAITGVCIHSQFHAEAPMRLESLVMEGVDEFYETRVDGSVISFLPAIRQICLDQVNGISLERISTRFHNTVTDASYTMIRSISAETGIRKVVLSGGTFQNKYLHESLENKLLKDKFAVYTHTRVPCNDGGIALGQMAVAAHS
jgi:hydrogenase maturation protein HypF